MKKHAVRILVCLLSVAVFAAAAEAVPTPGIFPRFEDFYVAMPSLSAVVRRAPDREETLYDGSVRLTWRGVTGEDFDAFSVYLWEQGCSILDYAINGNLFTAEVGKGERSFSFRYDAGTGTAEITYSAGTYPEADENDYSSWVSPVSVGDVITFGRYPQMLPEVQEEYASSTPGIDDSPAAHEPDDYELMPIEWIVLDVDPTRHRALVISRWGLDAQPYNTERTYVTWRTCSLRAWLNDDFLNTAFTQEEQNAILVTDVDNSVRQGVWRTDGGNDTQDRVFLLSYAEFMRFFATDAASICAPTDYALSRLAGSLPPRLARPGYQQVWWLRSPGNYQNSAASVGSGGSLSSIYVNSTYASVRPAFWINLDSDLF